jgi:hypothetical protein
MTVLDVRWFNPGTWFATGDDHIVGVVRVEMDNDESDEPRRVIRYFIGTGRGRNQQVDQQGIADWGAVFPTAVGALLFRAPE